jgi:hypothetical protein
MDFYSEISDATASRDSSFFTPGRYVVRVDDWKAGATRAPSERPFYALETTILASDNHDLHPIGSQATCMQMKDTDMAPKNMKAYLMGVLGIEASQITSDLARKVLSPDPDTGKSPVAGLVIDVVAVGITTRAGNPFTKCSFSSRDPEAPIPELAHRSRAALESESDAPF